MRTEPPHRDVGFAKALARSIIVTCAACAAWLFVSNARAADVVARLGPPTRVVALPDRGQRLQYSLQPAGQYAWMVDIDAAGKVVRSRQVLNERDFQRIVPGTWTRADIEREFGPPARVEGVASWNGPIMTYRWRDLQGANMFYWVYLDPQDVARRAHPGMEARDRIFDFRF